MRVWACAHGGGGMRTQVNNNVSLLAPRRMCARPTSCLLRPMAAASLGVLPGSCRSSTSTVGSRRARQLSGAGAHERRAPRGPARKRGGCAACFIPRAACRREGMDQLAPTGRAHATTAARTRVDTPRNPHTRPRVDRGRLEAGAVSGTIEHGTAPIFVGLLRFPGCLPGVAPLHEAPSALGVDAAPRMWVLPWCSVSAGNPTGRRFGHALTDLIFVHVSHILLEIDRYIPSAPERPSASRCTNRMVHSGEQSGRTDLLSANRKTPPMGGSA